MYMKSPKGVIFFGLFLSANKAVPLFSANLLHCGETTTKID